ncbi:MAG TPA: glycosyltransferase, partial [Telluria sp.]|nr:glycosyltransferase [Telluria sp.]
MLTVLMATHNGAPTLRRVLDAYCALRVPAGGWTLRVVDDGSTDGTRELLATYARRLPLHVLQQARRGKSAALNRAIDAALDEDNSDLFVLTDDDAVPDADWLLHWLACAQAQPGYALFGGAIHATWPYPPPAWVLKQVPLGLSFGVTACVDGPVFPGLVWGANMAVRRTVFEDGHRFDPHVGPGAGSYAMGSETEFNRRVAHAGVRAWFSNAPRVGHLIRPHQLTRAWALERARRHGRGMRFQDARTAVPRLLGVPRWMLARYALETWKQLRAQLVCAADAAFGHAWERAQLAGYFAQAWRGKRPAHILFTGASGELGGMEWRLAQDAIALSRSGYRSTVALPRFVNDDRLKTMLAAQGIALRHLDPPRFLENWRWRRMRHAAAVLSGLPYMWAFRPDVVHVSLCWTTYGASLAWLAARCGLPLVLGVHNAFPKAEFTPWQDE